VSNEIRQAVHRQVEVIVEALEDCSDETQEEFLEELEKRI